MADQPTPPAESAGCPDCWSAPGDQHELSCPTVSVEEFRTELGLPAPEAVAR